MALKTQSRKTLVLASSRVEQETHSQIAAGLRPRLDFLELAAALGGDVLGTEVSQAQSFWRQRLERVLASDISQAQTAWNRRGLYGAWLSTSEKVGLPLVLRGAGRRGLPAHVMIAHNLTSARKRHLHRLTGELRWGFARIICLSSVQEQYLLNEAGLIPSQVHRMTHHVDTQFYHPGPEVEGGYMLAVGRENRDYKTLIAAARQTGLPLVIVASSLWARRGGELDEQDLPPNVTLRQEFVSYLSLRDLYAGARLIAVPLHDCDYAAGSTGLLEGMAMGKPVVVSQTIGLADYLTAEGSVCPVPPADSTALSEALDGLWNDPMRRQAMGRAARAHVENQMNIEQYVQGVAAVVRDVEAQQA